MSKFYEYLTEKVNKKEINDVLSSTDVIIGAEFEFIVDYGMYEYEDAYNDYWIYNNQREKYLDDHNEWERDREQFEEGLGTEEYDKEMEKWDEEDPEPIPPDLPNYIKETYFKYYSPGDKIPAPNRNNYAASTEQLIDEILGYVEQHYKLNALKTWDIKEDGSLGDNGIEIASEPMSLKEFLEITPEVFEMIGSIGRTDDDCGLHIGISLKKGMDKIDPVKLALFTDEEYIWKNFSGRKNNTYAMSMKSEIAKDLVYKSTYQEGPENIKKLEKFVDKGKLKIKYPTGSHYHGVNVQHLDEDNPYIEFRYMGGEFYHEKWNEIKMVIAHYIYNLKLARDPKFKMKEYASKATRILRKIERIEVENILNDCEKGDFSLFNNEQDEKKRNMIIKNLKRKLIFLPKLTPDEKYKLMS